MKALSGSLLIIALSLLATISQAREPVRITWLTGATEDGQELGGLVSNAVSRHKGYASYQVEGNTVEPSKRKSRVTLTNIISGGKGNYTVTTLISARPPGSVYHLQVDTLTISFTDPYNLRYAKRRCFDAYFTALLEKLDSLHPLFEKLMTEWEGARSMEQYEEAFLKVLE